jgi:hypothetical protein
MTTKLLSEKYEADMYGVLNCFDRVVIKGNVQQWSYAKGMTSYLYAQNKRIFDYSQFAEPLGDEIRENAQALAEKNGLEIEFIRACFKGADIMPRNIHYLLYVNIKYCIIDSK